MYERFFGLTQSPFEASPDPAFLFNSPAHREAIATIEYGVMTGAGFVLLTGEVGLGKTTTIRTFLGRHDRKEILPVYVFHPLLDFSDLLKLLAEELDLGHTNASGFELLREIQRHLIELNQQGSRVVLVLDEAHRLPLETLENLRLLSNLETEKAKLLQIILVGQPELLDVLAQPQLRQLEQRIVLKVCLVKLTPAESRNYLVHRLSLAGSNDPYGVLSEPAIALIAKLCDGIPRRMNILAHRVLIEAFGLDQRPASRDLVRSIAAQEQGMRGRRRGFLRWAIPSIAVGLVIGIAAAAAAVWQYPARLLAQAPAPLEETRSASAPVQVANVEVPPAAPVTAPAPQVVAAVSPPAEPPAPEPPAAAPAAPEPTVAEAPAAPPPAVEQTAAVAVPVPAPADAAPAEPSLGVAGDHKHTKEVSYMVASGDTVWSICRQKYGPEVGVHMISKVMARNNIATDTRLLAGYRIQLPAAE